jgi:lipoprotein-anchoring transpeptidase ErfK/SrfK
MNRLRIVVLGGVSVLLVAGTLAHGQLSESAKAEPPTPPTAPTASSAPASAVPAAPHKTAPHTAVARRRKSTRTVARSRGQQKIDTKRTEEIQQALIREHYMNGEASGVWNDETEQALRRYQSDNNWQTKTVPDARALIKLGLGPDQEHLLNPDSAMTAAGPASTGLPDSK